MMNLALHWGWPQIASLSLTGVMFFSLAWYVIAVWRRSVLIQKEISRFDLFAARDALVHLVIDGKMQDSDPAWRQTYEAVSTFLGLHRSLHILDVVRQILRFAIRTVQTPQLRDHAKKVQETVKRARKENKDFDRVSKTVERAFLRLVEFRTSWFHHALVRAYLIAFRAWVTLMPPRMPDLPRGEARKCRRDFGRLERVIENPTAGDLAAFSPRRQADATAC